MDKVIDILTRLSFDADPSDIEEVNKHITKQSNLVKELESKIESLNKERKKSGLSIDDYKRINTELAKSKKALDNLNGAYKEQTGLIEKLTNKQKALQDQIRTAGSVAEIKALNKELTGVNKELSNLTNLGGGVGSSLKGMAANFAAGLTAMALFTEGVQFLNKSFAEFEDSERITNKLRLTLSNFGKQKYFDELTKQADTLAKKIGYLDNDDIVNAQEKLVTYGKLSINQIKQLTPVIVEFAAKQQTSVEDATDSIIRGLEGQGRAFRTMGVSFKDGKTTAENFKTVMTEVFSKVKGAAEDYGNTLVGQNAKVEQALKDMEETTGRYLAPIKKRWNEVKLAVLAVFTGNAQDARSESILNQGNYVSSETNAIGVVSKKYDEAVKKGIATREQADKQFQKYLADRQRTLQEAYDKYNSGFLNPGGKRERAADALARLKAFQAASAGFITSPADPNADKVVNPNADTELTDAAQKAADKLKELQDKRRALEESTSLRLIELNAQVNEQKIKGEDETIDKIKERIELERKAELEKLDMEINHNRKAGILTDKSSLNYSNIRTGINTKYDDLTAQSQKAFQEKQLQEIEKFDDQVFEAEVDLIRRKAELNKNALDAQINLIDAEIAKEIRVSNAKYNELIRQAKKFGKDYANLLVDRQEEEEQIIKKGEQAKADAAAKIMKEVMDKMNAIFGKSSGSGKDKPRSITGMIFGMDEEEFNRLSDGKKMDVLTRATLENISIILAAEIDKEDKIIAKQKERVEKARELAKTGNSAILTAETDRLQKQEEAQKRRLKSQQAINAALVISQQAVNAAEAIGVVLKNGLSGDPYTAAFRVIAIVSAIVAGIAAVKQATVAADTGFFKGDYTGDGNPHEVAGVVHKREFVYTAKQTDAIGKENLRYIAQNELKPMMLKDGSMVLSKTGDIDYAGIQEGFVQHKTAVPVFDTRKLESKIDTLTEVMSHAGIDLSIDENGLALRAQRIAIRRTKLRNL